MLTAVCRIHQPTASNFEYDHQTKAPGLFFCCLLVRPTSPSGNSRGCRGRCCPRGQYSIHPRNLQTAPSHGRLRSCHATPGIAKFRDHRSPRISQTKDCSNGLLYRTKSGTASSAACHAWRFHNPAGQCIQYGNTRNSWCGPISNGWRTPSTRIRNRTGRATWYRGRDFPPCEGRQVLRIFCQKDRQKSP